jgi:surface polysaccharide O-acyltransferase-like enzyme
VVLLAVSAGVQWACFAVITHWQPPASIAGVWWHYYATFVPYQFFVFAGAVTAVHLEEVRLWLHGKSRWLFSALTLTGLFALGTFWWRVWGDDQRALDASSAFQPTLFPFLICAVVCLYAVGQHWAEHHHRKFPLFDRVVTYASNRSFSVFLVHALLIFFILYPHRNNVPWVVDALGAPWATIVLYLGTLGGSLLVVEALRRLPGAVYLTGRHRLPMQPKLVPDQLISTVRKARGRASTVSRT